MTGSISWVPILGKEQGIGIGFNLLPQIAERIVRTLPSSCYAIVTDTILADLHLPSLRKALSDEIHKQSKQDSSRVIVHCVAPGEGSKSRQGKAQVEDFLLKERCTRDTVLLALGGGVVGDLSGFVAATFMRGIRYVQIPTTLLAMVDSAVGGKTAVDVPAGKNLIGAFHQPEYTMIDLSFLETLPEREFSNGMAEVVKTAAIWDSAAFNLLESGAQEIKTAVLSSSQKSQASQDLSRGQTLLFEVVKSSVSVKAYIVTKDEKETGLRNLVNFGHTIGHAIEAVLTPQLLHGEAVSIGMVLEAEIARALGILRNSAVGRLTRCLKSYNLPVAMDEAKVSKCPNYHSLNTARLMDIMRLDKKNAGLTKKIVLLSKIGQTYEEKATGVKDSIIEDVLATSVRVSAGPPSKQDVKIATPGSKSISNRALILAALGNGTCRITNLLHSDDTQVMITALERLQGAKFGWEDDGETLVVEGGSGVLHPPTTDGEIYLGNAGTAARFLTTVCTLAQVQGGTQAATCITGNRRMKERPIGPLVDALQTNGAQIVYNEAEGCLPLRIGAMGLRGGHIQLSANISSQYVSSILLAAPYAQEEILLDLVGDQVISQPYIDMTCAMMRDFGVAVERLRGADGTPLNRYSIPKGVYKNPATFSIESDASSATYPLALAAINGTTCTLTNIGTSSLQGDARFAKDVLEPMGCKVIQTKTSTTVTGPPVGQLQAIGVIDMEPMTDAFMTAAVLAAVANATSDHASTRIVGIANQRVKECNRIAAMKEQFAKFGIETHEHEDGIEVFGRSPASLRKGAVLHCYDDHRIAMSLSVLASVAGGPGAVVTERRCVAKTWPSWFSDMSNQLGYTVNGVELDTASGPSSAVRPTHDSRASIILIGMRGSGKTFAGGIAATAIGRAFIDADDYFESHSGMSPKEFVHQHGWPAFRVQELAYFREILRTKSQNHIIAMGGGIVETPEAFEMLKEYTRTSGPVINVMRDLNEVIAYLDVESGRPKYGEAIEDVAKRRAPLFKACSSFDFVSHTGVKKQINGDTQAKVVDHIVDNDMQTVQSITRFFYFITQRDLNFVDLASQKRTYFLSLTFPDIIPIVASLPIITNGVDAVELRVDLLQDSMQPPAQQPIPSLLYVGQQLAVLRKYTKLPIVYTVRTVSQGGRFPDAAHTEYLALLLAGLRWGCEYIDLEISQPRNVIDSVRAHKGLSQIIASNHDWTGKFKWNDPEAQQSFDRAAQIGDVVKIVGTATCLQDNYDMMAFRQAQAPQAKPLISINMGEQGQLSRILNDVLSPVTHGMLAAAAPGQLSFADIQRALHLIGQLPKRQFYLLGMPIAHSKSPLIHNTAFSALGLPHVYSLHETRSVDDSVKEVLRSPFFGGASVTIPHKLDIIPLLDELSPEADAIGAVNTIVPVVENGRRKLVGTNTDWIGIRDVCLKSFKPDHERYEGNAVALILGAGGTTRAAIYALHQIGFKHIVLYNRSLENAQNVANGFPTLSIQVTDSLDGLSPAVIVSTVPSDGTATKACPNPNAGIFIPDSILSRRQGGVIVDMSYKPQRTPLIRLAEGRAEWTARPGIEVLLYQAFEQFRLWTGRECPREIVTSTVMSDYLADEKAAGN